MHALTADELRKIDTERYKGHLSLCEIDYPGQLALINARVLIVGAGGLGSPVALYLAASGIGHIGIVDADTVSLSNLQRQIIHFTKDIGCKKVISAKQKIADINPSVDVSVYDVMLTPENARGLIREYDVVVDCTDCKYSRLLVNDACVKQQKFLVSGAVSRFSGLLFVYKPGAADYRDIFGDDGDDEIQSCAMTGILNAVVGVVGTLMATEVIKIITKTGDILTNRLLVFDALTMEFKKLSIGGC